MISGQPDRAAQATPPVCSPAVNTDNAIEALGLLAGACTTIAFAPQVIRLYRRKTSEDVSLVTFSLFVFGVSLWLVYGVVTRSLAIIVANGATLTLAGAALALIIRYRLRPRGHDAG